MAVWNVHSLRNKSFIVNDFISDKKLDCMCLTETWLGLDSTVFLTETSPPNYNFYFSTRSDKGYGGTASIISTTLATKPILFDHFITFEHHAFIFSNPRILCVTIYRPPDRSKCHLFIKEFSDFLTFLHNSYDRIVLTGDFNLHIDNILDTHSVDFLNVLNSFSATIMTVINP